MHWGKFLYLTFSQHFCMKKEKILKDRYPMGTKKELMMKIRRFMLELTWLWYENDFQVRFWVLEWYNVSFPRCFEHIYIASGGLIAGTSCYRAVGVQIMRCRLIVRNCWLTDMKLGSLSFEHIWSSYPSFGWATREFDLIL